MANKWYDRSKPKWEWGDGWASKGMTEKQYDYIVTLASKANLELTEAIKNLNRGGASGLIEELKRVADYGESTRYLKRDWSKYVIVGS
jgi:hypothetical protein